MNEMRYEMQGATYVRIQAKGGKGKGIILLLTTPLSFKYCGVYFYDGIIDGICYRVSR